MIRYRNLLGPLDGAAILSGCALLVTLSLLRQAVQPSLDGQPATAVALSVLVYVLPAAVAGAIAPRAWLWNIVLLAIFAGAFLTWQAGGFDRPTWTSPLLYKVFLTLALFSAGGCAVGMLIGVAVRRRGRFLGGRRGRP